MGRQRLAPTHTYKTITGAVSNEPDNTTFFFMQDAQTFTISAPTFLKIGQKFYCLFSVTSGVILNIQSVLVSNAHTFGLYFKTAANIFGFGVLCHTRGLLPETRRLPYRPDWNTHIQIAGGRCR